MKQVSTFLSTYTADVSGICSALYELGGMVIMDDASGCNSTYNTHDEPRWYTMDSMIYISALTELDAMLGDDEKLIGDICKAAGDLNPRFIALCGAPIPMLVGTDFEGIARVIEDRTGIPTFGLKTNGMHSYLSGIDLAFSEFVKRFCKKADQESPEKPSVKQSVNLLGVTPLDFSITGNVEAMKSVFQEHDYPINSCFAMGCTMEELAGAGNADVNVIVSSCGISAAKYMEAEFGIPYVVGIPMGDRFTDKLLSSICLAAQAKENLLPAGEWKHCNDKINPSGLKYSDDPVIIIGEPVFASSLRYTLAQEFGYQKVTVISPLETDPLFLTECDHYMPDEDDIREQLKTAKIVIADPLYRRIIPKDSGITFLDFPHEAYSGRIYRDDIPVFIGKHLNQWLSNNL